MEPFVIASDPRYPFQAEFRVEGKKHPHFDRDVSIHKPSFVSPLQILESSNQSFANAAVVYPENCAYSV